MTSNLKIEKVKDINDRTFKNLQQLYEFEFSIITKTETNEYAEYDQQMLKSAWSKNGFDIYILKLKNNPIGFAVININSMIDGNINTRDIAEFFVLPLHRNKNYGKYLAHKIFDIYEGRWEVRQLSTAQKAHQFWLKTIREYTNNNFIEEKTHNSHHGDELFVQKFETKKKD